MSVNHGVWVLTQSLNREGLPVSTSFKQTKKSESEEWKWCGWQSSSNLKYSPLHRNERVWVEFLLKHCNAAIATVINRTPLSIRGWGQRPSWCLYLMGEVSLGVRWRRGANFDLESWNVYGVLMIMMVTLCWKRDWQRMCKRLDEGSWRRLPVLTKSP